LSSKNKDSLGQNSDSAAKKKTESGIRPTYLWWNRPPPQILQNLEETIISRCKALSKGWYVDVKFLPFEYTENKRKVRERQEICRIWTRRFKKTGWQIGVQKFAREKDICTDLEATLDCYGSTTRDMIRMHW